MATARSFYYRERTLSDDVKKPSFNFHFDRNNLSASMKDFYYLKGVQCEQPEGAGLFYNPKSKDMYNLRLEDDEVALHTGMSYHILSAGLIPA